MRSYWEDFFSRAPFVHQAAGLGYPGGTCQHYVNGGGVGFEVREVIRLDRTYKMSAKPDKMVLTSTLSE